MPRCNALKGIIFTASLVYPGCIVPDVKKTKKKKKKEGEEEEEEEEESTSPFILPYQAGSA